MCWQFLSFVVFGGQYLFVTWNLNLELKLYFKKSSVRPIYSLQNINNAVSGIKNLCKHQCNEETGIFNFLTFYYYSVKYSFEHKLRCCNRILCQYLFPPFNFIYYMQFCGIIQIFMLQCFLALFVRKQSHANRLYIWLVGTRRWQAINPTKKLRWYS